MVVYMLQSTKLTIKQDLFTKKYVEHKGNGTQAALEVYDTDSPRVAQNIASENLSNPIIQNRIDQILNKQNLSLDKNMANIGNLANSEVEKPSANAVLKANIELLKLRGAYGRQINTNVSLTLKGKIKDLDYQDLKKELTVVDEELKTIMGDK